MDVNDFCGFEWGSMTFTRIPPVDSPRRNVVYTKTAAEPEEAWRFLCTSNTETYALMTGSRVVRKELAMRPNGELTVFGKQLLWALLDPHIYRALELLEQKKKNA